MEKRVRKSPLTPDIISLGKQIEEIIKLKGLKTREVAHDADLDVENLRKYIKVSTMLKIVKSLGVSVADLFKFYPND
jgi:DNA-binding Xre family transcriptional regulator